jgi:hypothetical protein
MTSPALRHLARELAPLIAQELGLAQALAGRPGEQREDPLSRYDTEACRQFVSPLHLGDTVLLRARVFFQLLQERGRVNSLEVVEALDLKGPTSIPANLTNPLKKRSARLRLSPPWREAADRDNRTVWIDQQGNAKRLLAAIEEEIRSRRLG